MGAIQLLPYKEELDGRLVGARVEMRVEGGQSVCVYASL